MSGVLGCPESYQAKIGGMYPMRLRENNVAQANRYDIVTTRSDRRPVNCGKWHSVICSITFDTRRLAGDGLAPWKIVGSPQEKPLDRPVIRELRSQKDGGTNHKYFLEVKTRRSRGLGRGRKVLNRSTKSKFWCPHDCSEEKR